MRIVSSRQRLYLVLPEPSALSLIGFHAIPIRGDDLDDDFGAFRERLEFSSALEWGGLKFGVWIFDLYLNIVTELMGERLQVFQRSFRGVQAGEFLIPHFCCGARLVILLSLSYEFRGLLFFPMNPK